jgi:hypothetical protein
MGALVQTSLFGDDDVVTRPALPHGCSWDCLFAMIRHGAELRVNHRLKGYFVYWRKEAEHDFWPDLRRDYMGSRGYPDSRIRHWMTKPGWEDCIRQMIVEAPEAVYREAWRQAEESGAARNEIDWRTTILVPEDAYAL